MIVFKAVKDCDLSGCHLLPDINCYSVQGIRFIRAVRASRHLSRASSYRLH